MYGGTQSEMERLVKHAAEVDKSIDANSLAFDNIVRAIRVVQDEMGITGTTAKEAGRTIEGSVNAMKSAWTNLVTGFADKNADIEGLINDLVTTIVGDGTENNLGVIGNVLPAVETALVGIGTMIEKAVPVLAEKLPGLLEQILPVLLSSATSFVNSVVKILPELVDLIVDALIDNAPMLIVAATELILALAMGLIEAVPELIKAIPTIIEEVIEGFKKSNTIKKFAEVGKNIIDIIKNGIKNGWDSIVKWFTNALDSLFGGIGDFFGGIFGGGNSKISVDGSHRSGLDYVPYDGYIAELHKGERVLTASEASGYGGTSIGNITINIDGAKYSDEQSLASAIALEIQNMTDRRAAVYA